MRPTLVVLLMLGRLLGVVQILTGLALWMGWLSNATALHIALGSLLVLVLWMIALIALFVLPARTVPLVALFWGGVVLWLGMAQTTLLAGPAHWSIRIAHLVVGLAALGLIESLAKATKRHWSAAATMMLLLGVGGMSADAQTSSRSPSRPEALSAHLGVT
jgi:hypothetical protein